MTETNGFLPSDYEAPKSESNYLKLQKGENKIRILSKPIIGWVDWKEKKPIRFTMKNKPSASIDPKNPIKFFWAFIVWSYEQNKVMILEITQKTVQKALEGLAIDPDWGNPYEYDIKIKKTGTTKDDTEYAINPVPHKKVAPEISKAFEAIKPIDLDALFSSKDPLENSGKGFQENQQSTNNPLESNLAESDSLPF